MPTVHVTGTQARALGKRLQTRLPASVYRSAPDDGRARIARAVTTYTAERWSKNASFRFRRDGGRYITKVARQARQALATALSFDTTGPWPAKKTWLDIVVYRPHMIGDPINVLDAVADSVKKSAIQLDDRWFAIKRLDWRIDPIAPRIVVTVTQEGA